MDKQQAKQVIKEIIEAVEGAETLGKYNFRGECPCAVGLWLQGKDFMQVLEVEEACHILDGSKFSIYSVNDKAPDETRKAVVLRFLRGLL